jgi:hypothetical protein
MEQAQAAKAGFVSAFRGAFLGIITEIQAQRSAVQRQKVIVAGVYRPSDSFSRHQKA